MKFFTVPFLFLICGWSLSAQINMADSTAQVVGYWDLNEKQTYFITDEKYKVQGNDTSNYEISSYWVDVTIIDSAATSYVIDWFYKDFKVASENALTRRIATIAEDMHVKIKTDEYGVFQEVMNWEDVRDFMYKATAIIKDEFDTIPHIEEVVEQVKAMFSTKESIELGVVKEIQQFYTFHGALYELGEEYTADTQTGNMYGGDPFDTKLTVWLDELNPDDNNFIIRMIQSVDSEQLTKTTVEYLNNLSKKVGGQEIPVEKFPEVTNDTYTASRIHGSGWVIYSIETRETMAEDITNIEERIIEIMD